MGEPGLRPAATAGSDLWTPPPPTSKRGRLTSRGASFPTCVPTHCPTSSRAASGPAGHVSKKIASNYGGVAALQGGLWNLYFPTSKGIKCADGSTAPTEDTWWINPYLLTGTHTKTWKAACGLQPDMVKKPFSLVFKSPLPTPIDRFPLHCQALQPYCPD